MGGALRGRGDRRVYLPQVGRIKGSRLPPPQHVSSWQRGKLSTGVHPPHQSHVKPNDEGRNEKESEDVEAERHKPGKKWRNLFPEMLTLTTTLDYLGPFFELLWPPVEIDKAI